MKRMICVLLILVSSFLTGCGWPNFDWEKYFQDADPNTPLMITRPTDGMVVDNFRITVQGIGYEEGMSVWIITKGGRWGHLDEYGLVGHYENGSWYCELCLLWWDEYALRAITPSGEAHEVRGITVAGQT